MEVYTHVHCSQKRYDTIVYNRCGKSGLKLPVVSLGLWHNFGDTRVYENMKQMCFTAFDNGITHFDLANNYGPAYGSAERNFGKLFREELHPYRDEMFISTKAGFDMWEGPYGNWGSRKYLLQAWTRVLSDLDLIMSISSIITEWILRHHLRRLWVLLTLSFEVEKPFM